MFLKNKNLFKIICAGLIFAVVLPLSGCFRLRQPSLYPDKEVIRKVKEMTPEACDFESVKDISTSSSSPKKEYTFKSTERDFTFTAESFLYNEKDIIFNYYYKYPSIDIYYWYSVRELHNNDIKNIVSTYTGSFKEGTSYNGKNGPVIYVFTAQNAQDIEKFVEICEKCNDICSEEPKYNHGNISYNDPSGTVQDFENAVFYKLILNFGDPIKNIEIKIKGRPEDAVPEEIHEQIKQFLVNNGIEIKDYDVSGYK